MDDWHTNRCYPQAIQFNYSKKINLYKNNSFNKHGNKILIWIFKLIN